MTKEYGVTSSWRTSGEGFTWWGMGCARCTCLRHDTRKSIALRFSTHISGENIPSALLCHKIDKDDNDKGT